ncbi:hypothetical protein D3C71_1519060 [compost metagenome]
MHTPAHQHGRQNPRAHTDVKRQRQRLAWQRGSGHQVYIFATHRRENAVVRMDAVARWGAQRRHFHAFLAPFVRTHHPQQLTQRGHGALAGSWPPGFGAGLAPIGRTAQPNAVVALQRDQDRGQHACALRLRLAMQVKRLGRRGRSKLLSRLGGGLAGLAGFTGFGRFSLFGIRAPHQGLQQHAGVLKIPLPQEAGAFAGHAVRRIGGQSVVGCDNPARSRGAAFGAPSGLLNLALAAPFDHAAA